MLTSVVILAHNQNIDTLPLVVESLYCQSYADFELVMISNSRDVDSLCKRCLVAPPCHSKIIFTEDLSIGMARNEGVFASSGEIIVFLDGDTAVGGVNTLSKVFNFSRTFSYGYGAKRYWSYPPSYFERNASLYISRVKHQDFEWMFESSRSYLPEGIDVKSGYLDLSGFSFIGNFGFVKRSLFDSVGGFDSRFTAYGGEDDFFAYRLYCEEPDGFINLAQHLRVLHISHSTLSTDTDRNRQAWSLLKKLLQKEGICSFNINVLFGIPNFRGEPVLERSNA